MSSNPFTRPMADDGDPNAAMTLLVGIFGMVLTAVVVIWVHAIYNREVQAEMDRKAAEYAPVKVTDYESEQQELLESYGVVGSDSTVVRVPIERAMELEAEKQN